MKDLDFLPTITCSILTAIQPDEVKAWISLVCTGLVAIVSFAYKIYCWYLKAKEDKRLSKEEAKQLVDLLVNGDDDDDTTEQN